jgi:hypothetical protein
MKLVINGKQFCENEQQKQSTVLFPSLGAWEGSSATQSSSPGRNKPFRLRHSHGTTKATTKPQQTTQTRQKRKILYLVRNMAKHNQEQTWNKLARKERIKIR